MKTKKYRITYINQYGQKEGYFVTGTKLDIAIEIIHVAKLGGGSIKVKEA